MSFAIVYQSATGNTALLAENIRGALPKEDCLFSGSQLPKEKAGLLFVGFWTDKGDCAAPVIRLLEGLDNQRVALFGTAGFGVSQEYFQSILQRAESHLPESCSLVASFMCQGKMRPAVRERYEAMLAKDPEDQRAKIFIANFDQARSHPDEADLAGVRAFALRAYEAARD